MTHEVVITGMGVIASPGDTPESFFSALCEGRTGLGSLERFDAHPMKPLPTGEIKSFHPANYLGKKNFRPLDRVSQLAISTAQRTLDHSGWTPERRERQEVGLALGTMFCGLHTIAEFDRCGLTEGPAYVKPLDFANTVINAASGQTAIWHGLWGVNSTIATGSSSGLSALAYAMAAIRNGRLAAILAGGVEELCFESMYGFYRAGMLAGTSDTACPVPFDERRSGFAAAEGAVFFMLEAKDQASESASTPPIQLCGYGAAYDYSQGQDETVAVAAFSAAMRQALEEAGILPDRIDAISASACGSVRGDRIEALALSAIFGARLKTIPVTAIKSMTGETLGASAVMQTLALIQAMRAGTLPGVAGLSQPDPSLPGMDIMSSSRSADIRYGLVTSMSVDGNAGALVVKRS